MFRFFDRRRCVLSGNLRIPLQSVPGHRLRHHVGSLEEERVVRTKGQGETVFRNDCGLRHQENWQLWDTAGAGRDQHAINIFYPRPTCHPGKRRVDCWNILCITVPCSTVATERSRRSHFRIPKEMRSAAEAGETTPLQLTAKAEK